MDKAPKTPVNKRSAKSFHHQEIDQASDKGSDQVVGHQRGHNRITERSIVSLRRSREGWASLAERQSFTFL